MFNSWPWGGESRTPGGSRCSISSSISFLLLLLLLLFLLLLLLLLLVFFVVVVRGLLLQFYFIHSSVMRRTVAFTEFEHSGSTFYLFLKRFYFEFYCQLG